MWTGMTERGEVSNDSASPSKWSGLLYGLGFGGFIDGIVLHQPLQWHHMVSDVDEYPTNTVAGLEVNTLVDGFFHIATPGSWCWQARSPRLPLGVRVGWRRTGPFRSA
jgi:uncharacterized membrane protein